MDSGPTMLMKSASSSSSKSSASKESEAEVEEDNFKLKPVWLDTFLQRTFFEECNVHEVRRNEVNKYCVSCDKAACQYCVSLGPHKNHRLLKIYRHVYRDVVSLSAMEKYMDCSNIQPYKSNKRLVISLNPLPHCGLPINTEKRSCIVCKRRLNEPNSHFYCCIACKVKAFENRIIGGSDPPVDETTSSPMVKEESSKQKKKGGEGRLRKRKGTPHRAPFF